MFMAKIFSILGIHIVLAAITLSNLYSHASNLYSHASNLYSHASNLYSHASNLYSHACMHTRDPWQVNFWQATKN